MASFNVAIPLVNSNYIESDDGGDLSPTSAIGEDELLARLYNNSTPALMDLEVTVTEGVDLCSECAVEMTDGKDTFCTRSAPGPNPAWAESFAFRVSSKSSDVAMITFSLLQQGRVHSTATFPFTPSVLYSRIDKTWSSSIPLSPGAIYVRLSTTMSPDVPLSETLPPSTRSMLRPTPPLPPSEPMYATRPAILESAPASAHVEPQPSQMVAKFTDPFPQIESFSNPAEAPAPPPPPSLGLPQRKSRTRETRPPSLTPTTTPRTHAEGTETVWRNRAQSLSRELDELKMKDNLRSELQRDQQLADAESRASKAERRLYEKEVEMVNMVSKMASANEQEANAEQRYFELEMERDSAFAKVAELKTRLTTAEFEARRESCAARKVSEVSMRALLISEQSREEAVRQAIEAEHQLALQSNITDSTSDINTLKLAERYNMLQESHGTEKDDLCRSIKSLEEKVGEASTVMTDMQVAHKKELVRLRHELESASGDDVLLYEEELKDARQEIERLHQGHAQLEAKHKEALLQSKDNNHRKLDAKLQRMTALRDIHREDCSLLLAKYKALSLSRRYWDKLHHLVNGRKDFTNKKKEAALLKRKNYLLILAHGFRLLALHQEKKSRAWSPEPPSVDYEPVIELEVKETSFHQGREQSPKPLLEEKQSSVHVKRQDEELEVRQQSTHVEKEREKLEVRQQSSHVERPNEELEARQQSIHVERPVEPLEVRQGSLHHEKPDEPLSARAESIHTEQMHSPLEVRQSSVHLEREPERAEVLLFVHTSYIQNERTALPLVVQSSMTYAIPQQGNEEQPQTVLGVRQTSLHNERTESTERTTEPLEIRQSSMHKEAESSNRDETLEVRQGSLHHEKHEEVLEGRAESMHNEKHTEELEEQAESVHNVKHEEMLEGRAESVHHEKHEEVLEGRAESMHNEKHTEELKERAESVHVERTPIPLEVRQSSIHVEHEAHKPQAEEVQKPSGNAGVDTERGTSPNPVERPEEVNVVELEVRQASIQVEKESIQVGDTTSSDLSQISPELSGIAKVVQEEREARRELAVLEESISSERTAGCALLMDVMGTHHVRNTELVALLSTGLGTAPSDEPSDRHAMHLAAAVLADLTKLRVLVQNNYYAAADRASAMHDLHAALEEHTA